MSEDKKRKFGPTRGEYLFRAVSGAVILVLVGYALLARGMPAGIMTSESILFGTAFGAFLLIHSSWKLFRRDYREV
ncbi:MAG: hypothetical protein AAGF78_11010 [Pseudomonadota bacterium]